MALCASKRKEANPCFRPAILVLSKSARRFSWKESSKSDIGKLPAAFFQSQNWQ